MRPYWVKTPKWLPKLFPKELVWIMPSGPQPAVYLSFDDGPHPEATSYVLEQLHRFDTKATFFCLGKNVERYPELYQRILNEGHATANHTQNHLNGWRNDNHVYYNDIFKAGKLIESRSFRPPYGRIKMSQAKRLSTAKHPWKIYMWDVLSGDFDVQITPEECTHNVLSNLEPGSIVVFHDSAKAFPRMKETLPEVLKFCKEKNWQLKVLPC